MKLPLHSLALVLSLFFQVSAGQEIHRLEPGKAVEREIAGGQSHIYQISLAAGQFVRLVVEQKAIDVALKIAAPDGKQLIGGNFGEVGELESLSVEAAAGGEHQVTISANGAAGSYKLRLEVKAAASAQDKQRMTAERLLVDVSKSFHQGVGALETTIEKARQALTIWRELGDRHWEAATANIIGQAYATAGTSEHAIEALNQALGIRRELKYRTGEGITLLNLGAVYHTLGRYEKAIEYYEQALVIFRELKNRLAEGNTLYNLGDASDSLSRYEKAIEYYEQALAIQRDVRNRRVEGYALGSLGNAYRTLGRYEKAIEYLEQALAINREMKDRSGEAYTRNNLGRAYYKMSRYERATEFCEQALEIFRELKERDGEASALYNLAQTERAQGNLSAARTHIEENLKLEEATRDDIVTPESRTSYLATVQRSYELYTDILMSQHGVEPTKGLDALAVEVSERERARSLLDQMSEANINLREGVDAALLERERALAKQLNDKAQSQASTPEQAAALKREISQLENDYEQAQTAIRKASPNYAALTQPQPLKLAEMQAQLDADTLLLEYALGSERSYLWAITRDSLTSYELPKGEQIKQNALTVYEMLTARSTRKRGESALQRQQRITQAEADLPAAAQALSQILLAPVAAQLANKRLVIVADGALQYIPFAMLPEPESPEARGQRPESKKTPASGLRTPDARPPLIVNHEIVSLPSASVLAIQRNELAGRQPAPKMLAVLADPVFDRTDARFTKPATETSVKAQPQVISSDDARKIEHLAEKSDDQTGVTKRRLVIPRLPFTRQEATRLLALTPKDSSFSAIGFQASRATVLKGELAQYRYVHFATHGLMDSERPGLSALVLSMVDEQGKGQDGFLRANDIYNLKLPAELVVLSACQTGLGKEIKGEGLVGLTRGFMYAGAARVVVSLWSVNDKATSELMVKFYEKMLKQGERPAAALRAAQVEMWKQREWQSPYYWAAFTLQGEWR
jgi:CHAT domain-containing protein